MPSLGDFFSQIPPEVRQRLMEQQMREAQDISNAVPRGRPVFQWGQPPALPELLLQYQPPERWNYGRPVRLA